MNKQELREYLEKQAVRFTEVYGGVINTHAESVDQRKRLQAKLETRKPIQNQKQQEWETYLEQVKNGTYQPVQEPEPQYKTSKKRLSKPVYTTDPMWRL